MITAGIDVGAKTVKIVLLKDGKEIVGKALVTAGTDVKKSIEDTWLRLQEKTGIKPDDISAIVATGAGKSDAANITKTVTEVGADAKGGVFFFPEARTVIDVGAEEGRAIRVDAQGKVVDFAINEKCAAGAGAFTEAMARALEVGIEELGPLSLKSTQEVAMNAQCAVFAESELVTLVHAKTPKPDMARAIHNAIADRITSMVRRVGMEEKIVLIGGVAKNVGFVDSLNQQLGTEVLIPEDNEFVGALGAALIAAEDD
ncbi:MAG: CoA activase [Deltaproteobacteria bacterium]|nr:CoA activase [Deltaproteobacteria bacterium]